MKTNLPTLGRQWLLAILLGAGLVGSPAPAASDRSGMPDRAKFRNRTKAPEPPSTPESSDLLALPKASDSAKAIEPVSPSSNRPSTQPSLHAAEPSDPGKALAPVTDQSLDPAIPPLSDPVKPSDPVKASAPVIHPSIHPPIQPSSDPVKPSEEIVELNPQDKLFFSIREDPIRGAAPEEVHVNAQGDLQFRVSRGADDTVTINVRNKTLAAVERELKAKLEADYYQKVTIELRVKEQTKKVGQVLFTGAVRGNFIQLLPGETKTLFEGVYQVGISEFANLKKVKLNRVNPQTRETESRVIDLESVRKGDRSKDVSLQDGDRVEVPEKSIVF